MNSMAAQVLPVPLSSGDDTPIRDWRDQWPDVLRPGVLYRGTFLSALEDATAHRARAFVCAVLADWSLFPMLDDALVCVSELATNAVRHSRRPADITSAEWLVSVGVRQWHGGVLYLEVGDYDRRMPVIRNPAGNDHPARLSVDGRGLPLIQALADRLWWAPAEHGGKVVYCRFNLARYGLALAQRKSPPP